MMPKIISIIIPCYNVEDYIERCTCSLAGQTIGIDKLEIILVDDGSADHTWEKLLEAEKKYPESIIIIHCDENGKQGRARNIGMEYASAPYLGFVDADDWVEPDMYEKLYKCLLEFDCDIAMCNSWRDLNQSGQALAPRRDAGKNDRFLQINTAKERKALLVDGAITFGACNKLYRTELLRQNHIRFPENLAYEDHYFAMLLYFYVRKIYFLEEKMYHYCVNNTSTVMAQSAHHHFDILDADVLLWDECEKRGFLTEYRKELEYQFLSLCYLTAIKMLLLRLSEVPYAFFMRMKAEVLKRVPNYHDNEYVMYYVTDLNKILLELLDRSLEEEELKAILDPLGEYVRKGILRI